MRALRRWHDHWSFWVPYVFLVMLCVVFGLWSEAVTLVLLVNVIFGGPGLLDYLERWRRPEVTS